MLEFLDFGENYYCQRMFSILKEALDFNIIKMVYTRLAQFIPCLRTGTFPVHATYRAKSFRYIEHHPLLSRVQPIFEGDLHYQGLSKFPRTVFYIAVCYDNKLQSCSSKSTSIFKLAEVVQTSSELARYRQYQSKIPFIPFH